MNMVKTKQDKLSNRPEKLESQQINSNILNIEHKGERNDIYQVLINFQAYVLKVNFHLIFQSPCTRADKELKLRG